MGEGCVKLPPCIDVIIDAPLAEALGGDGGRPDGGTRLMRCAACGREIAWGFPAMLLLALLKLPFKLFPRTFPAFAEVVAELPFSSADSAAACGKAATAKS